MTTFRFGDFEWDEAKARANLRKHGVSFSEGKSTKMARKTETDLSRYDLTRGTRGKYFEKARRSFETIIVDKKVAATLGGAEGVTTLLEALAKSLGQAKKKRRAA